MRFAVIFFFLAHSVSATTWVIQQNKSLSIRQTLDKCADGDTLKVLPGHYFEKNLVIKKQVCLIGENFPVLDGEGKYEIISIKADNVTVKGFEIAHSGKEILEDPAAIKIYSRRNATVANNILKDNFFGIYTQNGTACTIRNNCIRSFSKTEQLAGNGIHCWKCDSMLIIQNTVEGHRDGIYFEFTTHSVIWRNLSAGNIRYGLHFMFSNSDAYITNVFRNNGAGVAVMFTHGVKMFNNVFEENWGDASYGLLLKEIGDSYIAGNRFVNNTTGIIMEGTSRIQVTRNLLKKNGWAMKIQASCQDISTSENNFIENTFDVATNGSLVLNTFNGNYWDKYEGYDINKDGTGDVTYHPVSLFSMIIEKMPSAMMLFRSFMVTLLDKTEKLIPGITPENLKDDAPLMKPFSYD
jgi:nitrous oxidase accessory protein